MFQDIGVSKDLNDKFKAHLANTGPLDCKCNGITKETSQTDGLAWWCHSLLSCLVDFSIQVLSSGSWPFQQCAPFSLPAEVRPTHEKTKINHKSPFFTSQIHQLAGICNLDAFFGAFSIYWSFPSPFSTYLYGLFCRWKRVTSGLPPSTAVNIVVVNSTGYITSLR